MNEDKQAIVIDTAQGKCPDALIFDGVEIPLKDKKVMAITVFVFPEVKMVVEYGAGDIVRVPRQKE